MKNIEITKEMKDIAMDGMHNIIMDMADGNLGAVSFLFDCINNNDFTPKYIFTAFERMTVLNIKGSKLYLLWNDCCKKDTNKALEVMLKAGYEEILDHIDLEKHKGRAIPF